MNKIYEILAAGTLYASLLGNPCQQDCQQVNQENVAAVKQDSKAGTNKKDKKVIVEYSGERKVDAVKSPAEIRISKRAELEKLIEEKYEGREGLERATGYKLMLPFDSLNNYLLGGFYNEGNKGQGDVWIYGEKPVKPFRLTASKDVRESACFVPLGKEKGLIYLLDDCSGPALSNPEIPPRIYCLEFGVEGENFKIKEKNTIVLPEGTGAVYDIAYDPLKKNVVLDLKYKGNRGSYVLDGTKLYELVKYTSETECKKNEVGGEKK